MGTFADAFSTGVAAAETVKASNRKERQQQLTEQAQGYNYNPETGLMEPSQARQLQTTAQEMQLQSTVDTLQSTIAEQQSRTNRDDMKRIVDSIVHNDWSTAKKTLAENKDLSTKLKSSTLDTHDINPINVDTDMNLFQDIGLDTSQVNINDPEIRDALNSSYVKITGANGKPRVVSMSEIFAQTNQWADMSKQERDRYTERARAVNSIIQGSGITTFEEQLQKQKEQQAGKETQQGILKADIMNAALETNDPKEVMTAFMMTNPEKFLGKGSGGRRDALEQAVTAFAGAHPNATVAEWQNFYAQYSQKNLEGVGSVRETSDLGELAQVQKEAERISALPSGEFDVEEARNVENKIFAKLDEKKKKSVQEDVDKMKGNFNLTKNLDRILTSSATKIDKDVIADAKTFVEKKVGKESAQSLANVDFNTRTGILLANFMKEMSGTAVSDAEVGRLKDILLGGNLTDETYVTQAIKTFSSELKDQNKQLGSTLKDTAPYSVNKYSPKVSAADFSSTGGTTPSAADFD